MLIERTIITLFVLAVIFVNGATDAPNSIASAVGGGVLQYKSACVLCAVFNFLGLAVSGAFFPYVSESITSITVGKAAVIPLATVVIFSSVAWCFGIPTSESHALVAALGGVSLYTTGRLTGSFVDICIKSAASCVIGFIFGAIFAFLLSPFFKDGRLLSQKRGRRRLQAICAAGSSACHGMQDGQKFTAMLLPCAVVGKLPLSAVLIFSLVMGAGCLTGGGRITKKLGEEMTSSVGSSGVASDIGALVCTFASTLLGIPVSTTYMKTCSMLGASAAVRAPVNKKVALELLVTWAVTYPVCMAISYALCFLLRGFI